VTAFLTVMIKPDLPFADRDFAFYLAPQAAADSAA
jgi:hypothetical protein